MSNKKTSFGFTLAELLIVVAIIAVLVAISIPVFNSQMEKAREAVDLANIRVAFEEISKASLEPESVKTSTANPYAEVILTDDGKYQIYVKVTQTKENWQTYNNNVTAKFASGDADANNVGDGAYWVVTLDGNVSYAITRGDGAS